jgi:hypothetical protein
MQYYLNVFMISGTEMTVLPGRDMNDFAAVLSLIAGPCSKT